MYRSPVISSPPLLETSLAGLTLHRRGKVRDVYEVGHDLLIVTTDRISAFDYVLGSGIPDKGKVLTQLSAFWFERMGDLVPHHLIATDVGRFPEPLRPHADVLQGRAMLVRRTEPVPVECVARGYLSGSGWKEYQQTRKRVRREAAGRTSGVRSAAGADFHASHQGRKRARHQHQRGGGRPARGRAAHRAAQGAHARNLSPRRRARRVEGHHRRRHQVRVRTGRRRQSRHRHRPHRRGPDARLVALLAERSVRAWPRAAELRQAVRARLSRRDPVEQAAAGAVAAR